MNVTFRVTRLSQSPDPVKEGCGTNWDHVIRIVGPHMLGRASESELKEALVEGLFTLDQGADHIALVDEDFQKIKVQLMALGLTRITGGDASAGGAGGGCWTLTPYGRAYLMQLMAIKKPQKAKA